MAHHLAHCGDVNPVDELLAEMRQHLAGLQSKLKTAGDATSQSQNVNKKISTMKEVNTLNSCWRSKNRSNLVANLQHENRQLISLKEENSQLRFALKELEEGLHLIMTDYRRIFSGLSRSNLMLNLANARNCSEAMIPCNNEKSEEKICKLAQLAENCVLAAEDRMAQQDEEIARLNTENRALRELLQRKGGSNLPATVNSNCNKETLLGRKNTAVLLREGNPTVGVINEYSDTDQPACHTTMENGFADDDNEKTLVENGGEWPNEPRFQAPTSVANSANGFPPSSSKYSHENGNEQTAAMSTPRWPIHVRRPRETPDNGWLSFPAGQSSFTGGVVLKLGTNSRYSPVKATAVNERDTRTTTSTPLNEPMSNGGKNFEEDVASDDGPASKAELPLNGDPPPLIISSPAAIGKSPVSHSGAQQQSTCINGLLL